MISESPRLPGVFFEASTPARQETLPRMDIAAFVGFAASGPLHVPVAVDSPHRFRDVFGADPRLAWDDVRGRIRRGHLGGSVEAFFANGGVRCWIVRVADASSIVHHAFDVPGLIASDDRHASPAVTARARARAAGSWCEDLAIATALNRDPLRLVDTASGGTLTLAPGAYRIDVAAERSRLEPGDLLEVTFGPGAPVLLLFAARTTAIPGGMRIESAGLDVTGETEGAFWLQPADPGSPPGGLDPETTPPVPLGEAAALALALASLGSPAGRPVVRRLSFELLVFKGRELDRSLSGLAFGARHPRFWASLPTDDELFRVPPGSHAPDDPRGLALDALSPRFPLAGPEPPPAGAGAPPAYYLPWGMGRLRSGDAAVGLPASVTSGSTALERDGLAQFGSGLFLDAHLARLYAGALLGEAEHRYDVAGIPPQGLHALLPIDEASLVALPDAVHRGWTRDLPPGHPPLDAPVLDPIHDPDAAGRHPLSWTAVNGADAYTVQWDVDPAFDLAVTVFDGDAQTTAVALPAACPREVFFRVRASRDGEVGPWSNTRGARLPREDFVACEAGRPATLVLDFTGDLASPGPALVWNPEDPAEAPPGAWEVQAATDAGFATALAFEPDGMASGFAPLERRRFAPHYYRVRGVADGLNGAWSNTVLVPATERAAFTEVPAGEYTGRDLLALHRALLRFAAARGNLLALVSLPDHYRAADTLEHAGRLTPGGPEAEPALASSSPLSPHVPPLTDGESSVLSFGALYHPWIASRAGRLEDDGSGELLRLLPPDGVVAGSMASTALDEGAWRAPANRPFTGVLALAPALDPSAWARLVLARVNPILNDARGFLTRSEDTLGGERTLGRVHVRRLMILLRRLALREGERLVFEPHGPHLRRRVRRIFERLLAELFQRGAFGGADAQSAFRVVTDDANNPPSTVDRGRLVVELRVAPAAALAFLTVRLVTAGPTRLAVEEA